MFACQRERLAFDDDPRVCFWQVRPCGNVSRARFDCEHHGIGVLSSSSAESSTNSAQMTGSSEESSSKTHAVAAVGSRSHLPHRQLEAGALSGCTTPRLCCEHVMALKRGGSDTPQNIQLAGGGRREGEGRG
jgi:hypothetical protein